ncbi:NAD(P)-dependent oxidoreductase [Dactylosporangium sp. NPDC005572]|uniref:NAD(P)-dependent oxidoreductase n=1 Tax=Dactylosporangium sp. NPDC005572 TaxID=3156889 RepID=UPI0033A9441B
MTSPRPRYRPALRVGFVGLGDMGAPIARRIADSGFPTAVWARRPESLAPFVDVKHAPDLASLAAGCDVVGICVFDDEDVRDVMLAPGGLLAGASPATVFMVHSTIAVSTCRELAVVAQNRGVVVIDVPVSGSRLRAEAGTLSVMVGGPVEAVQRVRPVLDTFAVHVYHLGGLGSGLVAKALNNVLFFANLHLAATAVETAAGLGLDETTAATVLRSSSGSSVALTSMLDMLVTDGNRAEHARRAASKDLAVFTELRRAAGLPAVELEQIVAQNAGHVLPEPGRFTARVDSLPRP